MVLNLHWRHARIHGSAKRDARHSLVALADLLHGEEQDEPGNAHNEFAPLPVGGPDGAKEVVQLLVHWVMAGKADLRQLQDVCRVRVRAAAVAKDGLHLSQQPTMASERAHFVNQS